MPSFQFMCVHDPGMVVQTFNPSTQRREYRFLSSTPAWSIEWGSGLHSQNYTEKQNKQTNKQESKSEYIIAMNVLGAITFHNDMCIHICVYIYLYVLNTKSQKVYYKKN